MHNKKIISTVAALGLTVTLIGGTLAWFTSQDKVGNIFSTGNLENPDGANGNGVEIWEEFTPPTNIVPGDRTTKLAQVQNTTTYDSFIRVKITPKWITPEGNTLDASMIELGFGKNLGAEDGKWLKEGDYYYYMGKVAGKKFTNPLLSDVTLSTAAGSEYRNAQYEVLIEAESIQADNGAYADANGWNLNKGPVGTKLFKYSQEEATGNDSKANDNVTITSANERVPK